MKGLSRRQEEILRFIASFQQRYDRPPNAPEIARHFGFRHHSTAYEHLHSLARKGYLLIRKPPGQKSFTIQMSPRSQALFSMGWPLVGRIPAGPVFHTEDVTEEMVQTVEDLVPGIRVGDFFLRVQGDSMIEKGIMPGQLVLLRPDASPRTGDIAAVWVSGEGTTLKEIEFRGNIIRLIPANPAYPVLEHPRDEVSIQGVVIAGVSINAFRR